MTKKREILPLLNAAIICLSNMSADAAKLEINNNDQASRRIKKALVDFKHNELANFTNEIYSVRAEINSKPKKQVNRINVNNFATSNNS